MKKRAMAIIVICIALFLFVGCASSNVTVSPSPTVTIPSATIVGTPNLSASTGVVTSATANLTSPAMTSTGVMDATQVLTSVKAVDGVEDAVTAVYENKCVVGIKVKSGSNADEVKAAVSSAVRNAYSTITHIAVTTDEALYTEIKNLSNESDSAAKIDTLLSKINE